MTGNKSAAAQKRIQLLQTLRGRNILEDNGHFWTILQEKLKSVKTREQ
jgi:hypothetical protein